MLQEKTKHVDIVVVTIINNTNNLSVLNKNNFSEQQLSLIGQYGPWAVGLHSDQLPTLSFRRKEYSDLASWKQKAKQRLAERLAIPAIGDLPKVAACLEVQSSKS